MHFQLKKEKIKPAIANIIYSVTLFLHCDDIVSIPQVHSAIIIGEGSRGHGGHRPLYCQGVGGTSSVLQLVWYWNTALLSCNPQLKSHPPTEFFFVSISQQYGNTDVHRVIKFQRGCTYSPLITPWVFLSSPPPCC